MTKLGLPLFFFKVNTTLAPNQVIMKKHAITRRDALQRGGVAIAGMTLMHSSALARLFPLAPGDEVIPWLDQPGPNPAPQIIGNLQTWEDLGASWITPNDKFFTVSHYQGPEGPAIEADDWQLDIQGLVDNPTTLTLDQLKSLPRREVTFTLECAGNHGLPGFSAAIGTARWTGTPLAPLLQEASLQDEGIEVVFFGSDAGEETVREIPMMQNFARSMSPEDAMDPNILLCYEMNGQPLPRAKGYPVRLIAPGWYGIANVKWLKRIEVRDTRFMGRFMARDYVTIREEQRDGQTIWTENSVGKTLLKSVPARVTRDGNNYQITGAAWGGPVKNVEVRIDNGPWAAATIDKGMDSEFAWKTWHLNWDNAAPGEHAITSRAIDKSGNVQPAMDDPSITGKQTYWESNGQVTRRVLIS
jgi:DMSO/TMAO reductase YedYZ molybdopterin-dependent catalytic subunit